MRGAPSVCAAIVASLTLAACGGVNGTAASTDVTLAPAAETSETSDSPESESAASTVTLEAAGETPATAAPDTADATTTLAASTTTSAADRDADDVDLMVEHRIIPVDGDLAEIAFALGLGDLVVATDISATYPAEADALPEIGYQRALAAEPIAAFEPTIVLATDLAGPEGTLDDLERLDIETVVIERESTPDGPGNKIRAVGAALAATDVATGDGVAARADELAAEVDAQIAAATARAALAPTSPRVGVLYLRGENVQLLFGEGSGVDWLLDAAHAVDIADELGVVDNAPINAETLVVAAPDVLVVPERGLDSVGGIDGLLEVPGIAETPAGEHRRILVYDDQLLLGNGPRTGAFLDQLITDLHGDI